MIELKNIKHSLFIVEKPRNIEKLPEKNECFHFLTEKQHEGFEFFRHFEKLNIKSMLLIYSKIYDSHIEYFAKYKTKHIASKYIKNIDVVRKVFPEAVILENHSKVYCIKTDKDFFVLQGSGNLNRGAKVENYQLYNSEKLFKYYQGKYKELKKKGYKKTKAGRVQNNLSINSSMKAAQKFTKDFIKDDFKEIIQYKGSNTSMLAAILTIMNNEEVKLIRISTYGIATKAANLLIKIQNETNIDLKVLFHENIRTNTKAVYKKFNKKLHMCFIGTHAKLAVVETENNKYFMYSSANLNSNKAIETICIIKNNPIYDQYKEYFDTYEYEQPQINDKHQFLKGNKISKAEPGEKLAEKWTEQMVTDLGMEMIDWFNEDGENFLLDDFFVIKKGLYSEIRHYLSNKFPQFLNLLKQAKEIQKIKLTKNGLLEKTNPRLTIFVLNTSHDLVEKKELKTESEIKGTIEHATIEVIPLDE